MLLMIDNYDSFTYNLVQYFQELGEEVVVRRNDQLTTQNISTLAPARMVLSPGPCGPEQAGICLSALQEFSGRLPILGVCLGHQAIGAAFGGKVVHAKQLMHGKTCRIHNNGQAAFHGLPKRFTVTRYHSLAIAPESLPACLKRTAWADDEEIMGIAHVEHPTWGVQFHPESIATEHGHALLKNFLEL